MRKYHNPSLPLHRRLTTNPLDPEIANRYKSIVRKICHGLFSEHSPQPRRFNLACTAWERGSGERIDTDLPRREVRYSPLAI
jgi:hypothetical protein